MLTRRDLDPILYERLVKRFQTAQERAEEGKAKGYGRTLEASLIRGETNLANVPGSSIRGAAVASSFSDLSLSSSTLPPARATLGNGTSSSSDSAQAGAATAEELSLDRSWDQPVSEKGQGQQHWRDYLEFRFVHDLDDEFDYSKVDQDEDLDALQHKDAEDVWYDEEEPSWVDEDGDAQWEDDSKQRKGETGIQDY